MDKEKRQQKILSLIRARRVATQQELTALLERAGIVAKQHGYYTQPVARGGAAARGLLSLDPAGDCLVVARCEPGLASAVAVEIDRAALPEVVGTLAGEDTIFIAVADRKMQRAAVKRILELFD
jgi:transcriptional regulator of arginine metabolism